MAVKMMGILNVLKCLRRQANFFFFFLVGGGGGGPGFLFYEEVRSWTPV